MSSLKRKKKHPPISRWVFSPGEGISSGHNESLWCLLPVDELGSDLLHLATSASASIDPWSILIEIHHVISRADLSNSSIPHSSSPSLNNHSTLYIGECQGKSGACVIDFLNLCGGTEWDFFGCALTQASTRSSRHPHNNLIQDQSKTWKALKVSEKYYFFFSSHYIHNIDINITPAENACISVPLPILLYFIPIIIAIAFITNSITPIIVHISFYPSHHCSAFLHAVLTLLYRLLSLTVFILWE